MVVVHIVGQKSSELSCDDNFCISSDGSMAGKIKTAIYTV